MLFKMNSLKDLIDSKMPKPSIRENFLLLKSKINNYLNSKGCSISKTTFLKSVARANCGTHIVVTS